VRHGKPVYLSSNQDQEVVPNPARPLRTKYNVEKDQTIINRKKHAASSQNAIRYIVDQ
jgi:hypothetical protein